MSIIDKYLKKSQSEISEDYINSILNYNKNNGKYKPPFWNLLSEYEKYNILKYTFLKNYNNR